jgi:hypothetical protein
MWASHGVDSESTDVSGPHASPERGNRSSFRNVVFPYDGQVQNPMVLSVILHGQEPTGVNRSVLLLVTAIGTFGVYRGLYCSY